jgi:diguanylate cyclase (GGDEF)-like protein/PAS domain S-box-containing protein
MRPPGLAARILIVDDVPANIAVLGSVLSDEYDVSFATSGAEAIALARKQRPDLILLDVMMPGMSGHDVHEALRSDPALAHTAVIFVTADRSLDSELAGLGLGAEDYITKPIVPPILLARVKNVLERHRRARDLDLSLSSAEQGLWEWQLSQNEVRFNANWAIPLGYARDEMQPRVMPWQHIVHPDDLPTLYAAREACLDQAGQLFDPEVRMRHKDQRFVWMQLHGKIVEGGAVGQPPRMMGTYMNISRRKQAELELRQREVQLMSVIDSLRHAVVVLDQNGQITLCHTPEDSTLMSLDQLKVGVRYTSCLPETLVTEIDRLIAASHSSHHATQRDAEIRLDDGPCFVNLTLNTLEGVDAAPTGYLVVIQDVTRQRLAEEEIRALAFYDPVTRLPNERMFNDRLHRALARANRDGMHGALLHLDLDNFRRLEQAIGNTLSNRLLAEVAQRIRAQVNAMATVARAGSDTFLVLLDDLAPNASDAATEASRYGEAVLKAIRAPIALDEHEYRLTVSMGVALFGADMFDADHLLHHAELAMSNAKAAGGNALRFFDPVMQADVATFVALEQSIYKGLQQQDFYLLYQPQVDTDGFVFGVEALVRWRMAGKDPVSPGTFIPMAERSGLIVPLGQYILRAACDQLAQWQQLPATRHLSVAVNVSSRQFDVPGFIDDVELLVRTCGIDARKLKLEITESLLLDDIDDIMLKMKRLSDIGIGMSLDDFGTGYSSLAYLKKLPLNQVKIDQSFVRHALQNPVDAAIVRSIMSLGNSLNLSIIAEGVETEAEWRFLCAEGCTAFQGFYFGRPCAAEDISTRLSAHPPRA